MTQPTLTKRLKQMETEWAVPLWTDAKRPDIYAEEIFLRHRRKISGSVPRHKDELKKLQEAALTEIVIGASYTYSKYSLADVLVPYQVTHPNVKFRIVNDSSDALYRQFSMFCGRRISARDYEDRKRTLLVRHGFSCLKNACELSALPECTAGL